MPTPLLTCYQRRWPGMLCCHSEKRRPGDVREWRDGLATSRAGGAPATGGRRRAGPGVHDVVRRQSEKARKRVAVRGPRPPFVLEGPALVQASKNHSGLESSARERRMFANQRRGTSWLPAGGFCRRRAERIARERRYPCGLAAIRLIVRVATRLETPQEGASRLSRAWPETPQVLP